MNKYLLFFASSFLGCMVYHQSYLMYDKYIENKVQKKITNLRISSLNNQFLSNK